MVSLDNAADYQRLGLERFNIVTICAGCGQMHKDVIYTRRVTLNLTASYM